MGSHSTPSKGADQAFKMKPLLLVLAARFDNMPGTLTWDVYHIVDIGEPFEEMMGDLRPHALLDHMENSMLSIESE